MPVHLVQAEARQGDRDLGRHGQAARINVSRSKCSFVYDLRIPPTSNQAERDVRPAKTQQKISGRLRSEQATRDRYAIRGYISTASKHRIS